MTYLTRVPLTELRQRGQTLHNQVMSLFPADLPGDTRERRTTSNILFMRDGDNVFIQSDVAPVNPTAATRTMNQKLTVEAGDTVRFRTVVNPVVRNGNSARVADDKELWLAGRLDGILADVTVLHSEPRNTHSGRSRVVAELMEGQATVTDPDQFTALLQRGIGRAKSYGCGLMMVQVAA